MKEAKRATVHVGTHTHGLPLYELVAIVLGNNKKCYKAAVILTPFLKYSQ